MAIKTYRPTTQTLRYRTTIVNDDITTQHPHKPLIEKKQRTGGRRNSGDITSWHRGGGHKQQAAHHRFQARQDRHSRHGYHHRVRSQPLGAHCAAGLCRWREALHPAVPDGLKVGQKVVSGPEADILVGNALPLRNIPPARDSQSGIEAGQRGADGALSGRRGAVGRKRVDYALVKLPSGETRKISQDCMATVGQVGNMDHENITIGKAGRMRWMGWKPVNRGVSMNPVDHPHGGGEGKTSGGRHPVTPWGQPTRGYKTRNNKRTDKFIVNRGEVAELRTYGTFN